MQTIVTQTNITLALGALLFLLFLILGSKPSLHISKTKRSYRRFLNSDDISRKWLEDKLHQAKSEVLIVSGALNPRVYNPLIPTLRKSLERNKALHVSIVSGPKVLTLNGRNEVYELSIDNPFEERLLIHFLAECPVQHFRLADSQDLFVEDPHRIGETHRMVETIEDAVFKGWQYKKAFGRKLREAKRTDELAFVPIEQLN